MISSAEQQFREAASIARASGLDELTLQSMVTEAYNAPQVNGAEPAPAAEVIYDELPEGLIDLPSAATKYGRPITTLRGWVHRGKLISVGRLRAPAYGGGYVVVDEESLKSVITNPPKNGRPKLKPPA